MVPSQSESVGYDVTIQRKSYFSGMGVDTEWVVQIERLSDGRKLERSFAWRWRARRFARSSRRIGSAFRREAEYASNAVERFTIDMTDNPSDRDSSGYPIDMGSNT